MKRVFKFISRYIFKHPLFLTVYILSYLLPSFKQRVYFFDKSSVSDILESGKSIIRMGDGEIYILLDTPMEFHTSNSVLKKKISNVIRNYSESSTYILAVPEQICESNSSLKEKGVKNTWLPFKVMYFLIFPKNIKYIDAHMFYPYYDKTTFINEVMPYLRKKNLIFITKKQTIERIKESNMFHKNVAYVTTPERDAFSSYDSIKIEIDIASNLFKKKDTVLLFALGPVGKVIASEYSKQEWQCIDIGKGLDFVFNLR